MGADLLSPTHLIVLLVVGLLLFGSKRLPEIGRSLGSGMREFKDSVSALTTPVALTESNTPVTGETPAAGTASAPDPSE